MKILLLLIILLILPLVSSVSTTMLPFYQRSETMIIEIQGNILEPIERSDIIFKRGHVAIAVDYDLRRILDKYYLYAQVPSTSNNYTLFINNIATTVNGQTKLVNFNQTFEVTSNLTDYSINPGFIITNQDFSISINSNLDFSQTINSDFPEEMSIILNPGINNVNFDTDSKESGFYIATIGKYQVPIFITDSQSTQERISLTVYPKILRETLKINSPKSYNISIRNNGQQAVEGIYFVYNEDIFSLSNNSINLGANQTVNLSISLINTNTDILETILISKGSEAIENISFQIYFTQNDSQVTNSSNPEYYCSELGGKFCSATETCSGQNVQTLDGSCCVGICSIVEEESSSWILYLFIGVVLIVIIFIFLRYRKTKLPSPKNLPISSILKKSI
ncbi:hypothetical protein FJZ21_01305 [Candidatus Pacearchaeota archaeon]|nr:hypothetical protein [Candidatus Pacearchaeota archaeon]